MMPISVRRSAAAAALAVLLVAPSFVAGAASSAAESQLRRTDRKEAPPGLAKKMTTAPPETEEAVVVPPATTAKVPPGQLKKAARSGEEHTVAPPPAESAPAGVTAQKVPPGHLKGSDEEKVKNDSSEEAEMEGDGPPEAAASAEENAVAVNEISMCHFYEPGNSGKRKFKTIKGTEAKLMGTKEWHQSLGGSCQECCGNRAMLMDLCPGYMDYEQGCRPRCDHDGDDDESDFKCVYDVDCPEDVEELAEKVLVNLTPQLGLATAGTQLTKKICVVNLNTREMFTANVAQDTPVATSCVNIVVDGEDCALNNSCESYCKGSSGMVCPDGTECKFEHMKTPEGEKIYSCTYDGADDSA